MLRNLMLAANASSAVVGFAVLGLAAALHVGERPDGTPRAVPGTAARLVHARRRSFNLPRPRVLEAATPRARAHDPTCSRLQRRVLRLQSYSLQVDDALFALGDALVGVSLLGLLGSRASVRQIVQKSPSTSMMAAQHQPAWLTWRPSARLHSRQRR